MEQEILDGHDPVVVEPPQHQFPSHVQAYDILRRIGELEDARQSISIEIDECMSQLQAISTHIDEDSLLHRMLSAVFPKVVSKPVRTKRASKRKRAKGKR